MFRYRAVRAPQGRGYSPASNSSIPFIAAVFPVAAAAARDAGETVGDFDAFDIFGLFVAELPLHPKAQRRAMRHIQRLAVHGKGHDGLGVESIAQIDAFIILARTLL